MTRDRIGSADGSGVSPQSTDASANAADEPTSASVVDSPEQQTSTDVDRGFDELELIEPTTGGANSSISGSTTIEGETANSGIDRGEIFEVLSNDRRRYVIEYLCEQQRGRRIGFRELVDRVAVRENDTTIEQLDSSDRKCVYTALRQTHLPKLDSANVVDYDNQRGEVELADAADEVRVYMEYVPGDDISWSQVYLMLSAVCGLLASSFWIGLYPFGNLSGITIAIVVATVFGVSALVQAYHTGGDSIESAIYE